MICWSSGRAPAAATAAARRPSWDFHRHRGGAQTGRHLPEPGCVPTKTLLHASEVYRSAAGRRRHRHPRRGLRADIPEIFAYKSASPTASRAEPSEGPGVTCWPGRHHGAGNVRGHRRDGGD
ncbi:MAG: hypothetical protein ACLU38_00220 [Dysosmobacter sp.]